MNGNDEKNRMLRRYLASPNRFLMEKQMPRQQLPPRVVVPPPRVVEAPPIPEIMDDALPEVEPVILPVSAKVPPKSYEYANETTLVLCGKHNGRYVFHSKGRQNQMLGSIYGESSLFPIGSKVELTSGAFPITIKHIDHGVYEMGGKKIKIVSATSECGKESLKCILRVMPWGAWGGRRGNKRRGTKRRRTKRSTRRR